MIKTYSLDGVSGLGFLLIDDKEIEVLNYKAYELNVTDSMFAPTTQHKVDIFVENDGRAKYIGSKNTVTGLTNTGHKGFNGNMLIDDKQVSNFKTYPMEFKQKFVESLKKLKGRPFGKVNCPSLYRAELHISDKPRDTFLRLDNWKKGNVFVNGFNIGRYYDIGPQKTLYIPAPLLKTGINYIYVFELHSASDSIYFVDKPDLGK